MVPDTFFTLERKGKPIGDGSRPENGRAISLEGSTPSPSAYYWMGSKSSESILSEL
jgi:hypothetical protein